MTYYSGFLVAVPTANKQAYDEHARRAWPFFRKSGARRMVECWGVDLPRGKVTDFHMATQVRDDETVVFSWIEWPDRKTADAAYSTMMDDPVMQDLGEIPFDGMRMMWGGFEPLMAEGSDAGAGYVQGFLLAVPEGNRSAYTEMAREAWQTYFKPNGCLGFYENWGVDVPHGKVTDFYRATQAKDGEVVVFSWTAWPDRATCDAAARAMEAEMGDGPIPQIPFDGMRMMWGGFAPLVDETA